MASERSFIFLLRVKEGGLEVKTPFLEDALTANTKLVRVREQNGSTDGK